MTEKAWKSIPNGLVHLGLNARPLPHDICCNFTDKTLREILQRSHHLDSFECELDVDQKGVSEESLYQISKINNITKLKLKFFTLPLPLTFGWIANLHNLGSLDLRGKFYPLQESNELVIQICQNL